MLRAEIMEDLNSHVQVQRVLFNGHAPQPGRECRLLRGRIDDTTENGGVGSIVSTSVNYGVSVPEVPQSLLPTAHFFKEHFLIEPLLKGKGCRVTILSRADLK